MTFKTVSKTTTEDKKPLSVKQEDVKELDLVKLLDAVKRPDSGGRDGKKVMVIANLYASSIRNELHVTQYDVDIAPLKELDDGSISRAPQLDKPLPSEIMMSVFAKALDQIDELTTEQRRSLGYDGRKIAVTSRELPFNEKELDVELGARNTQSSNRRRRRLFRVKVQRAGQFSADVINRFIRADPEAIRSTGSAGVQNLGQVLQSLNIVFRVDAIEQYRAHGAGGNRFFDPNRAVPIANGAEIWRGFFQSVLPLRGGLFLNVDVAFSPFLSQGPFMEVVAKILTQGGGHGGGGGDRGRGRGRGGRGYDGGYGGRGGRGGYDDRRGGYGGGRGDYGGGGYGGSSESSSMMALPSAMQLQQLRKALRNVNIGTSHRERGKAEKFRGFTPTSARTTMFNKDGQEISVEHYFAEVYNMRLRYPEWPCVIIGARGTHVPPEVCLVIGNTPIPPQRMASSQVQDMIRSSAQQPHERLRETEEWRRIRAYEQNQKLSCWNVQVESRPAELQARILRPPMIQYRDRMGDREQPAPGSGKWNLRNVRFFNSGVTLITPVIVNFTRQDGRSCVDFMHNLFRQCSQLGMNINVDYMSCYQNPSVPDIRTLLNNAGRQAYADSGKKMEPQIFFCFLDQQQQDTYEDIKRAACTELLGDAGVPTQCINVRKAFNQRGQDQYCANVAMKVNLKLGGCNQILSDVNDTPKMGKDTMLIGLDVRHPPAGIKRESVVAAVTTLNGMGTRLGNQILTQTNPNDGHQQEAILNGQSLFANLLKLWMEENEGHLPKNIIVFRDGVSTGEYMQVKESEVTQLKQACSDPGFGKGYTPKVVYVISTKRHRIRFFAKDRQDTDKTGNLPAGLVVDSMVTHPYVFEFYLQAHSGLVGTCRPAKYIVLHDEMQYTSDEMERLINSLCYAYQRATRSVSQVPMAKYAHFLAEKASYLLFGSAASDTASSMSGGSGERARAVNVVSDVNEKLSRTNRRGFSLAKVSWFL